jgi:S-adenosylmethionine:tRNA ribosyltransferase-isomerase
MRLEDFDFDLPEELIAQLPSPSRDSSRLLVLDRSSGAVSERPFAEIVDLFSPGDLLVLNNTRVIPARLAGRKESGGKVEVFLVRKLSGDDWECMVKASKPLRAGNRILFPDGCEATAVERGEETWTLSFSSPGDFGLWLRRHGAVPLPPYIRRNPSPEDLERYQTVFAEVEGAVAAPTAGLHFTAEILSAIAAKGIPIVPVTLHVGLGTFRPIRSEDIREHRMHCEWYSIPEETATLVNATREKGGRVVALGTTAARALEHSASSGRVVAGDGEADIFIYPGYTFRAVDALVTNFHLPRSTLLLLVCALAGREAVLRAYREAVERHFRFFSYGDAMFIV